MPTINDYDYSPGCYVDGHWGNYGLAHMLERADEVLGTDYHAQAAQAWHETSETIVTRNDDGTYTYTEAPLPLPNDHWDGFTFEFLSDIADEAETALNEATPDGFIWHWHDGEFFLSPLCDAEYEECDDDTCACHC